MDVKFKTLAVFVLLSLATSVAMASDALLARLKSQGYVSDFAGVFSTEQRASLENFLSDLERQTGVEMSVVVLPSLEGDEVADFTNRLFKKWGVGKKGKDNGVMILAAVQDRKARIEVGYGLEPVINDALAGRIQREEMIPLFKQDRYADGLDAVARRLARIIRGDKTAVAPTQNRIRFSSDKNAKNGALVTMVFVIIGALMVGSGIGVKQVGMVLFGLLFSAVPLGLSWLLGMPWPVVYGIVAVLAGVWGFHNARRNPSSVRGGSGRGTTISWGGGFSGGGGFSSGGGFGGFGGGCSGGGGASSSW